MCKSAFGNVAMGRGTRTRTNQSSATCGSRSPQYRAPRCGYYFSGKCWVNNHTHVLRARRDLVLPKYLNVALSYYPFIPLTTGSTGRRKLTKAALMSAAIELPDLLTQERIVAEVDRQLSIVREVEAEVDANLKRAQALRQAILARAFGI
jgi:type I restriction enzyme, S subunit